MRVLAIVAHPDDEVLGCGGTLARHAMDGDEVHICILATGATSRNADKNIDKHGVEILENSAIKAAIQLGAIKPEFGRMPDNRLDSLDFLDVVKWVEQSINNISPQIVYTHFSGDLNIDHRITCEAVAVACRFTQESKVRALYAFETLSSTEWAIPSASNAFCPQKFVDISMQSNQKRLAFEAYEAEIREFPHPRSWKAIEALGRLRGSQAGMKFAEAFSVIRERS